MKKILIIFLFFILSSITFSTQSVSEEPIKIGVAFANLEASIWRNSHDIMKKIAKKENIKLIIKNAKYDYRLQVKQIEELIKQKVDTLVIVAEDSRFLVEAVNKAAKKGIKVIAFDRFIPATSLAAYVTFDHYAIGREQARGILEVKDKGRFVLLGGSPDDPAARRFREGQMEILKPLILKGQIEIIADQWIENWSPHMARKKMQTILNIHKNKIDAIIASNDGTALGALTALREQKLAGKIPISGQDATAAACNSIAKGELTMTVFKDFRLLAPAVMKAAIRFSRKQPVNNLVDMPVKKLNSQLTAHINAVETIPCLYLPLVRVNKDNLYSVIVKSGFQKYDDVYKDIPEEKRPPRP